MNVRERNVQISLFLRQVYSFDLENIMEKP